MNSYEFDQEVTSNILSFFNNNIDSQTPTVQNSSSSNYRTIPNKGGGDCAVYSIIDALRLAGITLPNYENVFAETDSIENEEIISISADSKSGIAEAIEFMEADTISEERLSLTNLSKKIDYDDKKHVTTDDIEKIETDSVLSKRKVELEPELRIEPEKESVSKKAKFKEEPSQVDLFRKDICKTSEYFMDLAELYPEKDQEIDSQKVLSAYQNIFRGNFEIFKHVIIHRIDVKLKNSDLSEETRENSEALREMLDTCEDWNNLEEFNILEEIFLTNNTLDIHTFAILEDHHHSLTKENYFKYASKPGVWLNNSEISAYLLSLGIELISSANKLNGTVIEYRYLMENKEVYLQNNAVNNEASSSGQGVHWQAARLADNPTLKEMLQETLDGAPDPTSHPDLRYVFDRLPSDQEYAKENVHGNGQFNEQTNGNATSSDDSHFFMISEDPQNSTYHYKTPNTPSSRIKLIGEFKEIDNFDPDLGFDGS